MDYVIIASGKLLDNVLNCIKLNIIRPQRGRDGPAPGCSHGEHLPHAAHDGR